MAPCAGRDRQRCWHSSRTCVVRLRRARGRAFGASRPSRYAELGELRPTSHHARLTTTLIASYRSFPVSTGDVECLDRRSQCLKYNGVTGPRRTLVSRSQRRHVSRQSFCFGSCATPLLQRKEPQHRVADFPRRVCNGQRRLSRRPSRGHCEWSPTVCESRGVIGIDAGVALQARAHVIKRLHIQRAELSLWIFPQFARGVRQGQIHHGHAFSHALRSRPSTIRP